jgi:hypothetical protein
MNDELIQVFRKKDEFKHSRHSFLYSLVHSDRRSMVEIVIVGDQNFIFISFVI